MKGCDVSRRSFLSWGVMAITAPALLSGCGGTVAIQGEGGIQSSEASGVDQSSPIRPVGCTEAGPCRAPGGVDASDDARSASGVLCGLNTGPIESKQDAGGPVLQCPAGDVCTQLNGQWTCCTVEGAGGSIDCLPFWPDGGQGML
jgi:hypothetical protein